ncbi:hypothetical protein WG906_08785 [Pedobacter sp. P351]|uniref:hypothetical protein n=1 Tax=Pedobacter superstes TaxID=3133441 RepID=UPI00309CFF13
MKHVLLLILSVGILMGSCSKSGDDPEPELPTPIPEETLQSLTPTIIAGGQESSIDGTGTNASFYLIMDICVDKNENTYVLEYASNVSNHFKIRKVAIDKKVTTLFNGGVVEFDIDGQNAISTNKTSWHLNNLAIDAGGNIYVLGSTFDYTTRVSGSYVQERGIFKLNQSTSKLESYITAKSTSPNVFATYAFDHFSTDGNGNFYCILNQGGLGKGEIYKLTQSGKDLIATIDNMFDNVIFSDNSGNIYLNVQEGITKVNPQKQISSYYKFETATTVSLNGKLTGDNSGNLIIYGQMFKSTGEVLERGFYKVTKEGKKVHIGKTQHSLLQGKMVLSNSNQLIFAPNRVINGGSVLMKLNLN